MNATPEKMKVSFGAPDKPKEFRTIDDLLTNRIVGPGSLVSWPPATGESVYMIMPQKSAILARQKEMDPQLIFVIDLESGIVTSFNGSTQVQVCMGTLHVDRVEP